MALCVKAGSGLQSGIRNRPLCLRGPRIKGIIAQSVLQQGTGRRLRMSRERKPLAEVSGKASDVRPMSKAAELAALLEKHRGERHAIVMQDYPDPDAISSAWAHKMIAARYGIDCDIVYEGRISHQENLALVQLPDIEMLAH